MLISVEQIQSEEGLHLAGTLAATGVLRRDDELSLPGLIAFSVRLKRQQHRVELDGWLHTVARVNCSRCLEHAPRTVEREFRVCSRPEEAMPSERSAELDLKDLDVDYYSGDSLDLSAILVEQVLLDLPMKLLCSEECRGLCPRCGANRNRNNCECDPVGDPRLAPLGELRDRA